VRLPALTLAVALAQSPMAMTDTKEPLRFVLRFPDAARHYVDVEARVPTGGRPQVELFMAVWTPGSYLVREYSRHVEAVRATDEKGQGRRLEKTRKNRWTVEAAGAEALTISYRVYGFEMGVRTNFVDRDFAFLNGAPTFLSLVGDPGRPFEVRIERPAPWPTVVTALDVIPGGADAF
jgi:predicted metalloprotease with PDZ domain